MVRMTLVFWHNILSPHQAPFMRHLAEMGHDVTVVSAEAMSREREMMGWTIPRLGAAKVILGPSASDVERIVKSHPADAIHVIAGARGTALGEQAAHACQRARLRMGIISEAPDPRGIGGPLRWAKYSVERASRVGRNFDFVMAMGGLGVRWFSVCGYNRDAIFPFAYVTELQHQDANRVNYEDHGEFRFVFAGSLIDRKGVDLLVSALQAVPDAELMVVGDGPEKKRFQELAKVAGTSDRVRWLGTLNTVGVQGAILAADALVLPSRHDGWGCVVNEALMLGTPVICSAACGASELVQAPWIGTIVRANDLRSLERAMSEWRARGRTQTQQRNRVRDWARCIDGIHIGEYFEEAMANVYRGGVRPEPPWRS